MPDVSVDVSQLRGLAEDLRMGYKEAAKDAAAIVGRGALNIKKDWQSRWRGHPMVPAIPYAINYDVKVRPTEIAAEIGVDKGRRQGPLGNLLEFGSVNNAPLPGGAPALAAEEPRFVEQAAKLVDSLLA